MVFFIRIELTRLEGIELDDEFVARFVISIESDVDPLNVILRC